MSFGLTDEIRALFLAARTDPPSASGKLVFLS